MFGVVRGVSTGLKCISIFFKSLFEALSRLPYTVVFDYIRFSKFHTHNSDDTLPRSPEYMDYLKYVVIWEFQRIKTPETG